MFGILLMNRLLSFFRFSRGPDNRTQGGARDTGGEVVKRPSILKQDDLKELDELDHDGDEGWAGTEILIPYYNDHKESLV